MIVTLPQAKATTHRPITKPLHKISAMHRQAHWRISDLPWNSFERRRVDFEILKTVKAASLVEYRGLQFSQYLCDAFSDDHGFRRAAQRWGLEEVQHGDTLGRYAALADPAFDFNHAYTRSAGGFSVNTDIPQSSRTAELIGRCMVEIGTISFYAALAAATEEPLLKAICRILAADEFRHYGMFCSYLKLYAERERASRFARLRSIRKRLTETDNHELAFAYYAANAPENETYDRTKCIRAFEARALPLYSQDIFRQGVSLMFTACGFRPYCPAERVAGSLAWKFLQRKIRETRDCVL